MTQHQPPDPVEVRRRSTRRVARVRTAIIGGAVVTSLAATGTFVALSGATTAATVAGTTTGSSPLAGSGTSTLVSSGTGTAAHATTAGS